MNIIVVNKKKFKEEIKNSSKVIVDFFATWCPPCKAISPIIEEFAKENNDIKVLKVNVDSEQELAIEYNVMSVPTIISFVDGNERNRIVGITTKDKIENLIK